MSKSLETAALALILAAPAAAEPLGLGREALPEEIAAWDIKVTPDGRGLPNGSGDVTTGEERYLEHCAACHGDFAEGLGNWPKLAGGEGTLARKDPVKTVGSYWPYLSTVWDYIHRSMPFGQAQILTPDDTYAITAYILYSNHLVDGDFVLSNENFLDVELPNADGFIRDDREVTEYPEFSAQPCMDNCKDRVEIAMRASALDVTPDDPAAAEAAPARQDVPDAQPATAERDPRLVAAGEKVFGKCKACHMVGADARNRVGPMLNGVMDRPVGAVEGFRYSAAMADAGNAGMVWDDQTMHGYLADPKGFLPRNKMSFAGLAKPEEIDALIAYLRSNP